MFQILRKKYCIFACGGHGSRMGESIPKQFLRIGGKTVLQLSMEKIMDAVPDVHIVVALPEEYVEYWKKECSDMGFFAKQSLVSGGITRFHSIRNALKKVEDGSIVAVHDGVRPLVSAELVSGLFLAAESHKAVVPVIPVVDTIKVLSRTEDGSLEQVKGASADRNLLFGAQTPQIFWSETLKEAYKMPFNPAFTDDASVVQSAGCEIYYTEGEKYNIKITTPEDLFLARRLLLSL